jgi:hypothetical protein
VAEEFAEEVLLQDGQSMPGTKAMILRLKKTLLCDTLEKMSITQAKLTLRFIEILAVKDKLKQG